MKKILVFAGSNSKNSINKKLAIYASELLDDVDVKVLDLNDFDLPMYSGQYEDEYGVPENAITFLHHIKESDGIILALAENNGAYTAVFKNLFDWMSRAEAKLFYGKPLLLLATSPGGRGAISVLNMAKARFPIHDAHVIADFSMPMFAINFVDGKITNAELDQELKQKIQLFKTKL